MNHHHQQAKILQHGKAIDTKEEFEAFRAEILQSLPADYKKMFGQIGFVKWQKTSVPVLILNPFAVPPGDTWHQWLAMYQKVRTHIIATTLFFLLGVISHFGTNTD